MGGAAPKDKNVLLRHESLSEYAISPDLMSDPSSKGRKGLVAGQVLVKFRQGTRPQTVDHIQQELGLRIVRLVSPPSVST